MVVSTRADLWGEGDVAMYVHLDVKYSFLHENINFKNISITYIPTEEQVADIFTKSLPLLKFEFLKSKLKLKIVL